MARLPHTPHLTWRAISNQWSILFTLAVAIWFGISALSFPNITVGNPFAGHAPPTSQGASVHVTRSSQITVKSFHLDSANGHPQAEATLEVHNTSSQTVTFRPDALVLRQIGGPSVTPVNLENPTLSISSGRSVIVPVSFPLRNSPGANYELTYGGNTVFTGKPI